VAEFQEALSIGKTSVRVRNWRPPGTWRRNGEAGGLADPGKVEGISQRGAEDAEARKGGQEVDQVDMRLAWVCG